jgi:hypothetical protein
MNKNRYYEPKTGHIYQWLVTDSLPKGAMFLEHESNGENYTIRSRKVFGGLKVLSGREGIIKALGLQLLPSDEWRTDKPMVVGWYSATLVSTLGYWLWWNGKCFSMFVEEKESGKSAEECASIRGDIQLGDTYFAILQWRLTWPEWAQVPPPVGYFEQ